MKNLFLVSLSIVLFSCSNQSYNEVSQETDAWHKNATIYEVNVRQFTLRAPLMLFCPILIEFTIWVLTFYGLCHSSHWRCKQKRCIRFILFSKDYKGVNPEHGTASDFKAVIDKAHSLGMKVLIDWVANHSAFDNPWAENKDWYTLDSLGNLQPPLGTDWWDVADLNYDNNYMRLAMIDAMQYCVVEFDIDGF